MRHARALAIGVALAAICALPEAQAQSFGPQLDAVQVPAWSTDDYASKSAAAWRGLIWPSMSGGMIDRLTLAAGEGLRAPDGRPMFIGRTGEDDGPLSRLTSGDLGRDLPSVFRFKTMGGFGFDVTPHAGVDVSDNSDSHDEGALIRFGRGLGDPDVRRPSRWFLFASADQETLGMNFLRNEDAWKRVGLGPDPGAVIGDTRAGVAWRSGPLEASVGYLYREIKPRDWDMLDAQSNHESMVAFRLSFHLGEQ